MSELAASFPDGLAELASRLSGLALGGELTLIIVVGGPGVGKSTLAREFASQTDSIHFELDEIKRRIVPEEDAKQGIDSAEHRYAYYAEAIRQLPEYFTRSPTHIVIVDETLHLQVYRQFWQEAADELDITVHWINANADDEVVKRRLLRGTGRKGHILGDESHDMYLLFGEQYDPMQRPHEDVDTGLDTVLQVRRIVERLISNLKSRLSTEGWTIPDEQLHILAGVLPGNDRIPDASVATDTEAAFILGDTLLIASWDKTHAHLITDLISLSGTPLTIEWNADWLSEYGSDDSDEVPDDRPMTVIVTGPSGTKYVLPFDEAWHNPVGCINFASKLIEGAHGFPPGVAAGPQGLDQRSWKR